MTQIYLECDGLPVRLLHSKEGLRAETYVPGKGFVRSNPIDATFHGIPLDVKEFEQLLLEVRKKKR